MNRLRVAQIAIAFPLALGLLWLGLAAWQWVPPAVRARPATCMPDGCFCEAIRMSVPAQPANTWSCVAFIWLGLVIVAVGWNDARRSSGETRNPIRDRGGSSVLYGGALILIGVGSGIYHASLTFVGQFFDVFGMYLVATFLLLYALVRARKVSTPAMVPLFVLSNAALAVLLWTVPLLRRFAFALLVLAVIGVELRARAATRTIRTSYFWSALGVLTIAFGIWVLDITRVWCAPTSYLQGHAIWHVLTAAAAGLIYMYYRSEQRAEIA